MLDVIDRGQTSAEHPRVLLLVHGAWHAGWCWADTFVKHFAVNGFRVLAPSLRGHGVSPVDKPLQQCSIADYVNDVLTVVDQLSAPPVLIGHSMGGFVVQKYLERHDAPAAVLLAATPPRGQLRSLMRLSRRRPWRGLKFRLTGQPADLIGSIAGAREILFSAGTPDELIESVTARLQKDSARAIFGDMVSRDLVKTPTLKVPVLVIGGACDQIYPPKDITRTAQAYRTEPVIFPDMGHELMLEPGWPAVATTIEKWLGQRGL